MITDHITATQCVNTDLLRRTAADHTGTAVFHRLIILPLTGFADNFSEVLTLSNGLPALHIRGTKTNNSDRVVPIPLEFYEYIRNTKPDEPVAMTAKGGPITENNRARIWNSFTRQINIEMGCKTYRNALVPPYPLAPDLVPYCLRHEYCTELARRGVDIRIAQKLMGHSDIQLTANIYTNLNNDDMADIAEMLSKNAAVVPH